MLLLLVFQSVDAKIWHGLVFTARGCGKAEYQEGEEFFLGTLNYTM
jgi:hypothetical protein